MTKLLKIAELGEEVLLKKAKPVKNVKNSDIQELINEMIATLKHDNGVGIAAPQVFQSLRIIIVHSYPNPRYPYAPKFGPVAMINPKITKKSKSKEKGWEGCLSIPGFRGFVPRHKEITVEYTARNGEKKTMKAKDFVARIIQHEVDHLDGRLCFLFTKESIKDLATEKVWQKIMASQKK